MSALKLTQIGNSVGLILPKEMLAKLARKVWAMPEAKAEAAQ